MRTLVLFLLFAVCAHAQNRYTRQYALDYHIVYTIPVAFDKGVTTLFFPTAISAIRGQKIVTDLTQIPGNDFYLKMNSYYFSVTALHPGAKQPITVIIGRKAFNIILEGSAEPLLTVNFIDTQGSSAMRSSLSAVSPVSLLGLLDRAKAYDLLARYHPEAVVDIDRSHPARIIQYSGFEVLIDDVFRFENEDSLVFRVILRNKTTEEILYRPMDVAIGVGDRIYPVRLWDATGIIPAGILNPQTQAISPGQTIAYFIVTGNPAGSRNNLDPDNAWNVLVPRIPTPQTDQKEANP